MLSQQGLFCKAKRGDGRFVVKCLVERESEVFLSKTESKSGYATAFFSWAARNFVKIV
ncbi:MAG: hypothetical protein QG632_681 [Candidatus Dependentiae bacterium]|nr:hypothetical protein [Candidatus Dependentiae bacterium]